MVGKDGQCLSTFVLGAFTRDPLDFRLLVDTQPLVHARHGILTWHHTPPARGEGARR